MSVSLEKGQKISLEKEAGKPLEVIFMGLGWDAARPGGIVGKLIGAKPKAIDLDASCLMFDENKNLVDQVWFNQLNSRCSSVHHTGDNRTGDGDGDDEQIFINLNKVPANVKSLVFTVNSYTGQTFSEIENATCRIVDQTGSKEIAKYNLSCKGNHTGMIMAKLYRHDGVWKVHAIGEHANGRTIRDITANVQAII